MTVTHNHMKAFRYCNRGGRTFFERHDLDWSAFVSNGIDAEALLRTGDEMAIALVKFVMAHEADNGQY